MGQISQEPQKLQKAVKEEISNDFFNTTEDKQGLVEIFPASYKHYLSTFYRTILEAIPNVLTGRLETWQCPTCKLEITASGLNNKVKNHQCQKCSKCNKYSSYDSLSLHELYECSFF